MDEYTDYRRWLDAESAGRDEDADGAFGAVFRAVPRPLPPSSGFAPRTMEAVAAAAAADVLRARRVRRIVLPLAATAGLALAYLCSGLLLSALSALIVGGIDLLIGAVVYGATTMRSGGDAWTLAGNLGRATAALLTSPSVTTTILALQGMAVVALIALQRLLRSEREPFR